MDRYHLNAHYVHWEGFSVKGNMGAHLQADNMKFVARSRKYAKVEETTSTTHLDQLFNTGRNVRAMQESRIARVEALKAQVRAGTYQVDSLQLAHRILENKSHFMESVKG